MPLHYRNMIIMWGLNRIPVPPHLSPPALIAPLEHLRTDTMKDSDKLIEVIILFLGHFRFSHYYQLYLFYSWRE